MYAVILRYKEYDSKEFDILGVFGIFETEEEAEHCIDKNWGNFKKAIMADTAMDEDEFIMFPDIYPYYE